MRDFLPILKTRPLLTYNFPLHGFLRRSACKILSESTEGKQKLSLQFRFHVSGKLNKRLSAVDRSVECLTYLLTYLLQGAESFLRY